MKLDDILNWGRLLGKLNDYILGQVFERLCQCQSMSIRQQLEAGIRYIDLRVAYHAESDSYHTCHGVYCVNVQEILQDIKGFMDENPKEIVIIEFKKLYGMEDAQYTALAQMIMDTLGDKMALKNSCPADATVQTYWDAGYQAVVLYQHNPTVQEMGDHKLWPLHKLDSPWPNAGTTEELHATLQEKVASHNPSKFFCAQGILTPDAEVIQREVLKGDGLSIRKLSTRHQQVVAGGKKQWVTSTCRHCKEKPETFEHLLLCDHPSGTSFRTELPRAIEKYCKKHKTPKRFQSRLLNSLSVYLGTCAPWMLERATFKSVEVSQQRIGWNQMLRGFLSKDWQHFLDYTFRAQSLYIPAPASFDHKQFFSHVECPVKVLAGLSGPHTQQHSSSQNLRGETQRHQSRNSSSLLAARPSLSRTPRSIL